LLARETAHFDRETKTYRVNGIAENLQTVDLEIIARCDVNKNQAIFQGFCGLTQPLHRITHYGAVYV
jgi:hypothetical protein